MKQAILFHPEGDYVTDFQRDTIQDVWEEVSDMGSRWIFYPLAFVGTDKTIVDTPEGMELLKGKRITTVKKLLNQAWVNDAQNICDGINEGLPLAMVYNFLFTS